MQVELRDQTFKENFRKMVCEDVLTTVVTSQKDLDGTSSFWPCQFGVVSHKC